MKRQRDDSGAPGLVKRPASSGVVRPAQAAAAAVNHRLTTNDALTYLREVKNRFQDRKDVYDTFLEIMKEFKAQRIDTSGVIVRVKDLFKGHRELILGFNTFLPKGYEIELQQAADEDDEKAKQPVEFDQAITYVNKIKTRFATDERVYKAFLEILNLYRKGHKTINNVYEEVAVLFRDHLDLLEEFTYFLPDTTPGTGGPAARARTFARAQAARQAAQAGNRVVVQMPQAGGLSVQQQQQQQQQQHLEQLRMLNKRKSARRVDDLMRRASDDEGEPSKAPNAFAKETQYFEKVKARLRNKDAYTDFLKVLNLFAQDIITKLELHTLVADMIGRHADLMAGLADFMTRCESMDVDVDSKAPHPHGRMNVKDLQKIRQISQREKFFTKPLSELVLTGTERCTPSYVRLPAGYPKLTCSGRTELGKAYLNDVWVSVTSGSEDYSFKLMRKNQYEEALFRCEDDRYELEMCIETNASALRVTRTLVEKLEALNADDRLNYRLEDDALSAVHFKAIDRIYGDYGSTVTEQVKRNPVVALPIILCRLEQKDYEWRKVKEDMTRMWKKVYEQNYQKSLDHRSFYFKQADKKNLATKVMLQEVKELADKNRGDEQVLRLLSPSCAFEVQIHPDIEYDYSAKDVHDDCFQVVRHTVGEMLSGESAAAVMRFWVDFVEPFFGLPRRTYKVPVGSKRRESGGGAAKRGMAAAAAKHEEDDDDDKKSDTSEDAKGEDGGTGGEDSAMQGTPGPEDPLSQLAAAGKAAAGDQDDDDDDDKGVGGKGARGLRMLPRHGKEDDTDMMDHDMGEEQPRGPLRGEKRNGVYPECAPLMLRYSAVSAAARAARPAEHVLYGNESLYYFFRFHRHLYERLLTAKRCCQQKNQPAFRQTGEPEEVMDASAQAARREEVARLHSQFMGYVRHLVEGHMDSSMFEDKCRQLLGNNSYVLFTLDKLVYKFVKHMQAILQDDAVLRLWDLYNYEQSRTTGVDDSVYHTNVHSLLPDEPVFRIAHVAPRATLTMQLMDPDRSDVPPYGVDPAFSDYVKSFMLSTPGAGMPCGVYLQRNVRAAAARAGGGGAEGRSAPDGLEAVLSALLRRAHVHNGLECKVACSSSKVSYVLDTEDTFWQPSAVRRSDTEMEAEREQRVKAFEHWLNTRLEQWKADHSDAVTDT